MNSEQLTPHNSTDSFPDIDKPVEGHQTCSASMLSPEEINELKRKTREKAEYLQKVYPGLEILLPSQDNI